MNDIQVFISYRDDTGSNDAIILYLYLKKAGYRVYLDKNEMGADDYRKDLEDTIKRTLVFLLILSEKCLDRLSNPGDAVAFELERAMEYSVPIIPIVPGDQKPDFGVKIHQKFEFLRLIHRFTLLKDQYYHKSLTDITSDLAKKRVYPRVCIYSINGLPGRSIQLLRGDKFLLTPYSDDLSAFRTGHLCIEPCRDEIARPAGWEK